MSYEEQLSAARFRAERDQARQEVKELREELEAMRPRLMPEGMEWLVEVWPKLSNGEYCKFGDWWVSDTYGEPKPKQFRKLSIYTPEQLDEWGQGDGESYGYEWDFLRPSDLKYRPDKVELPAPKALGADGVEIREGDTVYEVEGTGHAYKVVGIRVGDGDPLTPTVVTCDVGDGTSEHFLPSQLTHQRPVLDADGVPIKGGDTIYSNGHKEGLIVDGYQHDGSLIAHMRDGNHVAIRNPQHFTHTKPEIDTWERIEEDVRKLTSDYWGCFGFDCNDCPAEVDGERPSKRFGTVGCALAKHIDLVRRAKKLAERGQ